MKIRTIAAIPPTTPPAIAPTLAEPLPLGEMELEAEDATEVADETEDVDVAETAAAESEDVDDAELSVDEVGNALDDVAVVCVLDAF